MKNIFTKIFLLTIILQALLFVFPSVTSAKVYSKELAVVSKGEVVDDDLFISGETVRIDGTINGDLYAAGGNVFVTGEIKGDLIAAGGMIDISGKVADDLMVAGGNINVDDVVIGGSVRVAGGNVTLGRNAKISEGLVFGAGNFSNQASVGKSVTGGAGNLSIDAKIGKNVEVGSGNLVIGPNTSIGGDLTYTSDKEAEIAETVKVAGKTQRFEHKVQELKKAREESRYVLGKVRKGFSLFSFLASLTIAFVVIWVFKKHVNKLSEYISKKLLLTLGIGVITPFIVLPIIVILAFTIIGIPLSLILLCLFILEVYIAKIFVGLEVGKMILVRLGKKDPNLYVSSLLGLGILYILFSIRFIGGLVWLASTAVGLGAIVLFKKELLTKSRKAKT